MTLRTPTAGDASPPHEDPPAGRPDRVHLGWQYTLLHPDPGPPPRRPVPPGRQRLDPSWLAAQRREEKRLNQPVSAALVAAVTLTALFTTLGLVGVVGAWPTGLVVLVCAATVIPATRTLRRSRRSLRDRIAAERTRVERIDTWQERQLFTQQAEHAEQVTRWQRQRAAYETQKQWYAVSLPVDVDRIDVAGGTPAGWAALLTTLGTSRLRAGGRVTVLDLSETAAASDLLAAARASHIAPLVWVLPNDLPRLDLGAKLTRTTLADVLAAAVDPGDDHGRSERLAHDTALLERIGDVLGDHITTAQVTAALRVLARIGDPRDDLERGLLQPDQVDRLAALFGHGPTERLVVERAWALETQLRKLEPLGRAAAPLPDSLLRVLALDRRIGLADSRLLGSYLVAALTHVLRQAPPGPPWRHTLFLLGAERLRADLLDRLIDACATAGTGLVPCYRSIPPHVRGRLGRGNAAVAFMRLGNAEDAKAASEQIGTEHRFVLAQLTQTVGRAITDSTGSTYTSTVGTADSTTTTTGASTTTGHSRGHGTGGTNRVLPFGATNWSRNDGDSRSATATDSQSITRGITTGTTWGITTSRAVSDSESRATTVQRSREFVVEQHELQQLPPSVVILHYPTPGGRRAVAVDTNPGILGLPAATLLDVDEARRGPDDPPPSGGQHPDRTGDAAAPQEKATRRRSPQHPTRWRAGTDSPPPNLGPPPKRLDWRRPRA